MNRLKMRTVSVLSACMIAATLFAAVPIASAAENQSVATVASCSEQVTPRTEETVWVSRVYNGKKQMRLWSITRGIWLTDWIDYAF